MQVLSKDKLQIDPCAKYAVAFPKRTRAVHTRASWTRNRLITILHGAHWLGLDSFELALFMRHDPVEQRLINYTQRAHRRLNALDEAYQTHCLMLEFQRLARS